jgi:dimethylargininase
LRATASSIPPRAKRPAANTIRFNELVIMPSGFPRTAEVLDKAGYTVREVGNSEAAKLDGGMSCLSLRFSPPKPPS